MRICQVLPEFYMGGAETMCIALAAGLKKMGHDVCIVSLRTYESPLTERARACGIELHFMDKGAGLDLQCIPKLRRFLREWKPDIIHVHLHALKYAYPAAFGLRIPFVRTIHNIAVKDADGANYYINRMLFPKKVVPVSLTKAIQDTVVDLYHFPAECTPIIFNGVDLSCCIPKQDYSLSSPPSIIHIGRFQDAKNHEAIVSAVAKLNRRGIPVKVQLYGDGPLVESIRAQISEMGLAEQVRLCGLTNDVFPLLHNADMFILPSKHEGSPITIIEAMGTGLPIIAANVGGIPDMITDGADGLLISPDADELADAIAKLIHENALRKKLGENALKSAERFSAVTMAKEYLRLYESIIA